MMHYHGTPITPNLVLYQLAGKNFCVSYARADQITICHSIGQSVMLDNGAFSVWRREAEIDWDQWAEWAEPWLDYQTTWAVLPDSIEGDEEENDALLRKYNHIEGTPVWHLHESLDRLRRLVHEYGRVCFGSSRQYAEIGTDPWRFRVSKAFGAICSPAGRVPWIHMLRGMSLSGQEFPFSSVDSTDVGRNHNRPVNDVRQMADRWDSMQCPARWEPHEQLELT